MKTLMVLGVREEGHPYARTVRKVPYEILAGADNHVLPIRPSDAHIFMDSGDAEEVLRVARQYGVAGILGVGEAASLTASYAAQQLGLPGIPYAEEQLFHNMLLLRDFQARYGFRVPQYWDLTYALRESDLSYPVYVSPADGDVLRHSVRVERPEDLAGARLLALRHSPGRKVVAHEDLLENAEEGAMLVMTDLVVRGGLLQPLLWCEALRGSASGDCVPVGARYPARLGENSRLLLAGECARLVSMLQLQDADLPVLAYSIPGSLPYLLRVGVRDGAYVTTRFLSNLYRHDLLRDDMRIAAGDRVSTRRYRLPAEGTCRAYYNIPVTRTGILRHVRFAPEIRPYRKGFLRRARQSQYVSPRDGEGQTIGTVMLEFPDEATMDDVLARVSTLISVHIEDPYRRRRRFC